MLQPWKPEDYSTSILEFEADEAKECREISRI
jgi:hypothetical protein